MTRDLSAGKVVDAPAPPENDPRAPRGGPELAPLEPRAGVVQAPAGTRDAMAWGDRMLSGALRFRADELRARALAQPDDAMVTRIAIVIACRFAERAMRDVERAEHSIHAMLERPRRFTVAELQAARDARRTALDEFAWWCRALAEGAAKSKRYAWWGMLEGEDPDAWMRRLCGDPWFLGEGI